MKYISYITILVALVLAQVNLKAQDSETEEVPTYRRFVGGSISYFRSEGDTDDIILNSFTNEGSRFSFNPYLGFQTGKKTQLGITVGISIGTRTADFFAEKSASRKFELGFFLRNYLYQKNNFSFFLQSNAMGTYEFGRYTNPFGQSLEELDYQGPYAFTFRFNPRISYELNRFRFLATIGNAGVTIAGETIDSNDTIISLGGSTVFANALTNGLGISIEYKF